MATHHLENAQPYIKNQILTLQFIKFLSQYTYSSIVPLRKLLQSQNLQVKRFCTQNDYNAQLMATPAGFEPATCPLGGGCSIQLSHGAVQLHLARVSFGVTRINVVLYNFVMKNAKNYNRN